MMKKIERQKEMAKCTKKNSQLSGDLCSMFREPVSIIHNTISFGPVKPDALERPLLLSSMTGSIILKVVVGLNLGLGLSCPRVVQDTTLPFLVLGGMSFRGF